MSTRPAIRALMHETVHVAALVTRDAYGAPQYTPAVPTLARIAYGTKAMIARDGRETVSRGTIYLPSEATVGIDDQLTLPDGTTATPLDVRAVADLDGSHHHTEVVF